jgi:iron-sulfur cluster assembly accessory protein
VVEHHTVVTALDQALHHVRAHAAEADHSELHALLHVRDVRIVCCANRRRATTMTITLDDIDRAAARIAEITAAQAPGTALRVAVLAGGCNGFQYKFDLDRAADDDLVVEQGSARVLVDPASLDLLAGAELDYTDELMGSYFAVRNPQAKSACGCGTSFSVD